MGVVNKKGARQMNICESCKNTSELLDSQEYEVEQLKAELDKANKEIARLTPKPLEDCSACSGSSYYCGGPCGACDGTGMQEKQ